MTNKLKFHSHGGDPRFELTLKNVQVNEREVVSLSQGDVKGFLPVEYSQKGPTLLLTYRLSGLMGLTDYLKLNPIRKSEFVKLVSRLLEAWNSATEAHFDPDLIDLDLETIQFYPATFTPLLVYVPVRPFKADGNLQELFQDLISYCQFDTTEDTSYVGEYIRLVNNESGLSIYDLAEYCKKQNETDKSGQPYLIREKNGDKILITECPFKVGKQLSEVHYCVKDNPTVSRVHIEIGYADGKFTINDLNSTNGTFLNDNRLTPGFAAALLEGDKIRLSNEEFVYHEK